METLCIRTGQNPRIHQIFREDARQKMRRSIIVAIEGFRSALKFKNATSKFKSFARENRVIVSNPQGIVLVENRNWADGSLALLAFLPAALLHHNATPIVYEMTNLRHIFSIKRIIRLRVKQKFSVLNCIAKSKYMLVGAIPKVLSVHEEIINKITSEHVTKREFESFCYRELLLGDLIYDHYLRKTGKLTLDFKDPTLKLMISIFLQHVDYFMEYFEIHFVKAVIISHPVYHYGIPARIASTKGIPAYLVEVKRVTRIYDSNKFPYSSDWENLRSDFKGLTGSQRIRGLKIGEVRLKARISGYKGDLGGDQKWISEFGNSWKFNPSSMKYGSSVLVALHDFIDACHRYGPGFYPDFYEWLIDIAEMSKESNLNWLIKPHPWALRDVDRELEMLVKSYPHLKLVPSSFDNRKLVESGLKYCLTVHGHIAHELPLAGIVVVNASKNNPHREFDFSISPQNLEQFREMITNLNSIEHQPHKESLYEFYFMHYIFNLISWCIPNYSKFIEEMKTRREFNSEKLFCWYFQTENKYNLKCIRQAVDNYLNSTDTILGRKHFSDIQCDKSTKCKCQETGNINLLFKENLVE
jgi:hypothetical protein